MSQFLFLSYSKSIMHQCGITDLRLKQLFCHILAVQEHTVFTKAGYTISKRKKGAAYQNLVPLEHPNFFKFSGVELD